MSQIILLLALHKYFHYRDISHTRISNFPSAGLRDLRFLNADSCTDLKTFPQAHGEYDSELCTDLVFPFLSEIRLYYHALCCIFSDIYSLRPIQLPPDETSARCDDRRRSVRDSPLCINATTGDAINYVPDESEIYDVSDICEQLLVCPDDFCPEGCGSGSGESNYTSVACVLQVSESSSVMHSTPTLSSYNGIKIPSTETVSFLAVMPTSTNLFLLQTRVCWNGTVLVPNTSTMPTPLPVTTVTTPTPPVTDPPIDYSNCPCSNCECSECRQVECDSYYIDCSLYQPYCDHVIGKRRKRNADSSCTDIEITITPTVIQLQTCSLSTHTTMPSPSPVEPEMDYSSCPCNFCDCSECRQVECDAYYIDCSPYQAYCDYITGKRRKREVTTVCSDTQVTITPDVYVSLVCPTKSSTSSSAVVITTPALEEPPTCPPNDADCAECVQLECSSYYLDCTEYNTICDSLFSRKKRVVRRESNHRNSYQFGDCYLTVLSSTPMATSTLIRTPTKVPTSSVPSVSSSVPSVSQTMEPTQTCIPRTFFSGNRYRQLANPVKCYPSNDPFNPCTNIIDSDYLRASIWLVLLVSIGGNTIVITVTILYAIFRYRSARKEPSLISMLYINLAVADLLMGIYLATIAITDLITDGDYARHAVEWQTGPGCGFAGFCAVVSSLLSIYTLLVITIERMYSIKYALERKHFKKRWVAIVMLFGWAIGIGLAILPLVDVSSYERVSICLPFESRDTEDKAYILLILILTGIASLLILLSYIFIFYIVTCGPGKKGLHGSLSGREEMKIALRMSLLILTDFACWSPIAFFGITALFGKSLIGVSDSKVLMVFAFPLNSCLNPVLYSFTTRLFRQNFCTLINSCGLCPKCAKKRTRNVSSSGCIQDSSTGSHLRRLSTQLSVLPNFLSFMSLSSGGSTGGSRRGSTYSGNSSFEDAFPNAISHKLTRNSISSTDSGDSFESPAVVAIRTLREQRSSIASLPTNQLQVLPEENEENDNECCATVTVEHHDITVTDDSTSSEANAINGAPTYCNEAALEFDHATTF